MQRILCKRENQRGSPGTALVVTCQVSFRWCILVWNLVSSLLVSMLGVTSTCDMQRIVRCKSRCNLQGVLCS